MEQPAHPRVAREKARSSWTMVCLQDLRDLWLGGRGPLLCFCFSLLLSVIAYLVAARLFVPVESRASVIAMFCAAVAIWGVAAWALAFGRDERAWVLELLRRMRRTTW